ncbi:ShlB/FhaC/HecB family hemolysin secretion/activation protein [Simplicispira suum]|uniref:Peptide transporter n=1 Tax=Simplicispira suum TaxID=2109915 RepID=A0A2S0N3X0_9BURK|nr:ShlB/FhaC/HecB family hemolysin secretion/activation protein [Simplicispira suum]AVO42840.1 peptide transporter [Simplicispira suum]
MLKNHLLPFALLALSPAVFAQQPPSAGSQMQQIPPALTPQKAAPVVRIEPSAAPATPASDAVKITVNRLHVTGARVYPEAELLALTGFQPGSELSLGDLRGMALAITQRYRNAGYFVAQAYLPAQEITDGEVTIAVIEGEYGKVIVRNQSNLADDLVHSQLQGIHSGDPVAIEPLENRLLLLSDIPGVNITSTLAPGASPGTSDLIVDVAPGRRVTGSVDADNAGNRYTGEYRLGATVNLNNPAGRGDVASLRVLTSGKGLNYARASYQMQFGKATAGVAYSWLDYELGKEFSYLHATGNARIASLYGSYPLIRSRNTNLYAGLAFDHKAFQDKNPTDLTMQVADKKSQVLTASLRGDHRDSLGGGGLSSYSLAWSVGNVDLQAPGLQDRYALTQAGGHFNKLSFSAMRLQSVTDTVSLYAGINGQLASKNLDASEKMELGGMYGVRAYPEGEAYADQGYVLTLEARMALPTPQQLPGQMQLVGFVDVGSVTTHKQPWDSSDNRRTLSGAGVGLNWSDTNNFLVRTFYAFKLGNEAATSAPDKSGRFWIQAVKYF